MADAKLKIIISAADQASGTLGGIGKALSGIGGIAKGALVAGAGLAAGAIVGLGAALMDATREAMKAEEVQAQLNAVLRSTGGVAGVTAGMANDLADSLSKVTRFEDEAIISGESLLLTFTNIGKDIFPETTEVMLDMSQALGQDLKSSALQLGKALNDPIRGVTALTRVGVSFTEEQKAQIKALQESGDLMGAQKIILRELQREFGGAAKAAGGTFAGQLEILKNQMGNVKEAVGTALLPGLTQLATAMGPVLINAAEGFGSWLAQIGPKISAFAGDVSGLVGAITEFGIQSPEAGKALQTLFGPEIGLKIQAVAGWVTDTATGLTTIGTAITTYGLNSPQTFAALGDMLGADAAKRIEDVAGWLSTTIPTALKDIKTAADTYGKPAIDAIRDAISIGLTNSWTTFKGLWDAMEWGEGADTAVAAIDRIRGALETAASAIDRANGAVSNWINNFNAANAAAGALLGTLNQIGGVDVGSLNLPGTPGYTPPSSGPGGRNFQMGTPWAPGGWARVGERGPELVRLPAGSRVYSAEQSAHMLAQPAWNVTLNITGARDPVAVGREAQAGMLRAARALGVR